MVTDALRPCGRVPAADSPDRSRWRASPRRLAQLLVGLVVFGAGEGLIVASELGNSPWTVLAEGVAKQTGTAIGVATVAISFLILLAWVPLRQRPGLGTIANAVLVGVALDVTLALVEHPDAAAVRAAYLVLGIALVAVGSGLYLTTFLGPGTRDGLTTGLHRLTGAPISPIRTAVEVCALTAGWLLGGTLGIGTLAFALTIGPAVAAVLRLGASGSLHDL
jgi:uncharacterized membrane protein YczE